MPEPRRVASLAGAALMIHLTLALPNHPGALTWEALTTFPLELPVILLGLIVAGRRLARVLRAAVVAFLTLMSAFKLGDLASHTAFARPFNPVLDLHLADAAWRMLSGAIGPPLALAATGGLVAGLAGLAAALWWATGRIAAAGVAGAPRAALAVLLAAATALAAADAARGISPLDPPGAAFTSRLAWEHARGVVRAGADISAFRNEAALDPMERVPAADIMPALRGRDVLLIFVESYGRATIEHPLYAPTVTGALAEIEDALGARGLAMASGFLTAPMVGGQSWLAHASVLSGLWIDTQARYRALLASPRRTLLHFAQAAGWRTVAVMPAITLPWPEARYFGYDRVIAAADLGYAGPPFNWVTMPDQFTLLAFEREAMRAPGRRPVFAEIALISSHAPWTPIPPLLDWDAVGDGTVFAPFANAGDPPEVLWRDRDRVRDQFRQAIDYSLRVVGAFAARHAQEPPLIIVLGDHQPARFVSLDETGHDVPIHVIGPPDAVARLEPWGWTAGMIPAPDAPVWRMDAFRDAFMGAFADAAPPRCAAGDGAGTLREANGC